MGINGGYFPAICQVCFHIFNIIYFANIKVAVVAIDCVDRIVFDFCASLSIGPL